MTTCPIGYFHQLHPLAELSSQEFKTSQFIAQALEAMGVECQTGVGGTGVVAYVRGQEWSGTWKAEQPL